MSRPYCGIGALPGRKHAGSESECTSSGQLRLYGQVVVATRAASAAAITVSEDGVYCGAKPGGKYAGLGTCARKRQVRRYGLVKFPVSRKAIFAAFIAYLRAGSFLPARNRVIDVRNAHNVGENYRPRLIHCERIILPRSFRDVAAHALARQPVARAYQTLASVLIMQAATLDDAAIDEFKDVLQAHIKTMASRRGRIKGIIFTFFNICVGTEAHRGVVFMYERDGQKVAVIYDPGTSSASNRDPITYQALKKLARAIVVQGVVVKCAYTNTGTGQTVQHAIEGFFRGSCMLSTALFVYLMGLLKTTDVHLIERLLHATDTSARSLWLSSFSTWLIGIQHSSGALTPLDSPRFAGEWWYGR